MRISAIGIAVGDLVESESGERRRVARIEATHDEVILFDEKGDCLIIGNTRSVKVVERGGRAGG